jgi:hypothetical protein
MNVPGTAGGPSILGTKGPATLAQSMGHAAANAAYNALFTPPPQPPGIGLGSVGNVGQGIQPLPGTIVGSASQGAPMGVPGTFGQPSGSLAGQQKYPAAVLSQYAPALQPPVAAVPTPPAATGPLPTLAPQSHAAVAAASQPSAPTTPAGPIGFFGYNTSGQPILGTYIPPPSAPTVNGYHLNTPISPEELPTHALAAKPLPRAAIRR